MSNSHVSMFFGPLFSAEPFFFLARHTSILPAPYIAPSAPFGLLLQTWIRFDFYFGAYNGLALDFEWIFIGLIDARCGWKHIDILKLELFTLTDLELIMSRQP